MTDLIFEKFCPRCVESRPIRSFYAHISECRSCYRTVFRGLERRCSKCKQTKNAERDFYRLKAKRKPHSWCKECYRKASNDKYRTDPVKRQSHLDYRVKYHAKNRSKIIAQDRNQRLRRKAEVLTHYGNGVLACVCCGIDTLDFLTLDHVDANGADHRKDLKGEHGGKATGWFIYRWLMDNNYPEGYQTLCYNCNVGKHRTKLNKCPHQIEREALWRSFIEFTTNTTPPQEADVSQSQAA